MDALNRLLEAVNEYKLKHGKWPQVKISRDFWEEFSDGVARLSGGGVEIEVVDYLTRGTSFIIDRESDDMPHINTLKDLKSYVDRLFMEGKGDWPVVCMPPDAAVYLPIKLIPIVPGQEQYEGYKRHASIAGEPEGEHILVEIGD